MQVIDFIYPEKSEVKYRIDTYPDSQSHLVLETELDRKKTLTIYTRLSNLNDIWILMQIAYLFAARTDRLFSFNEALDLELVGKCLTFVQAQITSVIEPHSSRLISDGIILPNLTESAKELPNNIIVKKVYE